MNVWMCTRVCGYVCMYECVDVDECACDREMCEICVELSVLSSDFTSFNKASEGWCQWAFL